MKIHSKLKTFSHQKIKPYFNERFVLSLAKCKSCIVLDSELQVSQELANQSTLKPISNDENQEDEKILCELMESLSDADKPLPQLCKLCRTSDQAKAVLKMIDVLTDKSGRSTVSLTAARGRGKSASLGLSVAAAIFYGINNIYLVSPSPQNLETFFEFLFKGFDALDYREVEHYDIIQSTNLDFEQAIVRVNVFARHRQIIQYLSPSDNKKACLAELVVIDEAASIPMIHVRELLGLHNVFMASTIQGYEGTGRSLSLKLLQHLRKQSTPFGAVATSGSQEENVQNNSRPLIEVTLERSIRYSANDPVEKWLDDLFCLDATSNVSIPDRCPPPSDCRLYYINKDILFSGHRDTEKFLHQITSLLVSSHYRNSPDDLQILADTPAHHLFALLPPLPSKGHSALPSVFCVLQVSMEGVIPAVISESTLNRGLPPRGDLVPWTISAQFLDPHFTEKTGVRIVRAATHPDYQSMGYGSRAVSQLIEYYQKRHMSLDDEKSLDVKLDRQSEDLIGPRKMNKPLLMTLRERTPEEIDYLSVSFGITDSLFKFWSKLEFIPLYISLTKNKVTGEFNSIMVHPLNTEEGDNDDEMEVVSLAPWLECHVEDFGDRFCSLLGAQFASLSSNLAFRIIASVTKYKEANEILWCELETRIGGYDLKRLESYANRLSDRHLITDLIPHLSQIYFHKRLPSVQLSNMQACLLAGCGYQFKTIESVSRDLNLSVESGMGQFNRMIRRLLNGMNEIQESSVRQSLHSIEIPKSMRKAAPSTYKNDLNSLSKEFNKSIARKQNKMSAKLKKELGNLDDYKIKGNDNAWNEALDDETGQEISIKSLKRPSRLTAEQLEKELKRPNKKSKTGNQNKKTKTVNQKSSNTKHNKKIK